MRSKGVLGAALACSVFGVLAGPAQAEITDPHVSGEVIVQFERAATGADREAARDDAGTAPTEALGSPGLQLVSVEDGGSVGQTIRELESDPTVEFAEPNGIEQPSSVPEDPSFPSLWGLLNAGQTVNGAAGTPDADIDATNAWDIETGDPSTVIAVTDTGIDPTHPDLAANLWQNPGEIGGNGLDDDANGFVDDVNGYDFVGSEDASPLDAVGHGTHVSGTIAAVGANGVGVSGVSQRAQIMALRVCSVTGCNVADQTQAINYAAANGARVLNASLGGFSGIENQARRAAIFSHPEVLHVFAAGNDGTSAENSPAECAGGASPCRSYPCAHAPQGSETENIVCVAATTQTDALAPFSNFGSISVDLGAPGTNILSTNTERTYLNESFASAVDYAARWDPIGGEVDWSRTSETPLNPNFGITDSPGANYANNTTYGTTTVPFAVGAVSERGCEVRLRRSIDLAGANDRFRVALLHNDVVVHEYEFSSADNSSMQNDTLDFTPPLGAGNLRVRLRLFSANDATQANGVHVDSVVLECGETPGPHNYDFKQGTSMATPEVTGAAGLLISRNPAASTTEIRDKLLSTVDPNAALAGNSTTGGRLNIGTAMARMPADTSITSGPAEGEEIGARSERRGAAQPGAFASFGVASNDPAAGFQCSVDAAAFAPCGAGGIATLGPLGPGPHSVAIRSVDPRGNVDTTPATRSFAVESDAPQTTIGKGPKRRTSSRKAKFRFSSDEPGSTFECKVDRKRFSPCGSPRKLKRVKPGKHKFFVRAVDRVGNVDVTAAQKRWKVS